MCRRPKVRRCIAKHKKKVWRSSRVCVCTDAIVVHTQFYNPNTHKNKTTHDTTASPSTTGLSIRSPPRTSGISVHIASTHHRAASVFCVHFCVGFYFAHTHTHVTTNDDVHYATTPRLPLPLPDIHISMPRASFWISISLCSRARGFRALAAMCGKIPQPRNASIRYYTAVSVHNMYIEKINTYPSRVGRCARARHE